ncbi:MAG TPA: RNA methyltransferase [Verrucomicrobiae bacterium]|nr:RNA methyltransferase [Verrucomicrobiae bacterium]
MFTVRTIDSLELPELEPYRTMRRPQEHCDRGIFVAEGEKVVRRLLESGFEVVSLLLPQKWVADYEPLVRARPEKDLQVFVTEMQVLEQLVGFPMFQGVLAVGKIPERASLSDVLDRTAAPRLWVAIDGLTSAENVGTIVRNCAAFNAHALLVGENSSSPYLRRAVRNSMGAIFHLPIIESRNLVDSLQTLRREGVRVIGAHPHVSGSLLWDAQFAGDCCLVFGSEGSGLSPEVLKICDSCVAIPMPPNVDSLNVNAAAAVFLYEASRQRRNV